MFKIYDLLKRLCINYKDLEKIILNDIEYVNKSIIVYKESDIFKYNIDIYNNYNLIVNNTDEFCYKVKDMTDDVKYIFRLLKTILKKTEDEDKSIEQLIEERIRISIKENIKNVMEDAKKDVIPTYLNTKIINECSKKGYEYFTILKKIKEDEMYASFFSKDPLKQNIAENIQLEILNEKMNVEKLPQTGNNSKRLLKGNLGFFNNNDCTKALDFFDKKNNAYFFCKYTKENGGSQDNQFVDVIRFIDECNLYCNKNKDTVKFVAFVSGKFYTQSKINSLNVRITNKHRIFVINKI